MDKPLVERLVAAAQEASAKFADSVPPLVMGVTYDLTSFERGCQSAALAAALRELSNHIYFEGRDALRAEDNTLWEIRNSGADTWLDEVAGEIERWDAQS